MKPGEAVMVLTRQGFRFRLDGEVVKVKFEGDQLPEKATVSPLLDLLRGNRDAVREFLRCNCPKCGGVVFGIFDGREVCMACYYRELRSLIPGLDLKH